MSEQMPSEPSEPAAPPFAHVTLVVIALIHLGVGVLGLLATIDHLRDGWLQIHTNTGLLVVAIGLLIRSNFWRRVARWANYGIAVLLLLFSLAGFLFSSVRVQSSLPFPLGRQAILTCFLVLSIVFWWMARRLGTLRPVFPSATSPLRWFNRIVLLGWLAIGIGTGGSPFTYVTSVSWESSGVGAILFDSDEHTLWEQGFRDPALVEFRYPTHTRFGLFTKVEITRIGRGYSNSYSHSRLENADADPLIAVLQATGDYIICEIDLKVTPEWFPIGKRAHLMVSTRLKGVGKYEAFTQHSQIATRLIVVGIVSRSEIENEIYASIEQPLMRTVMRNAAPPLKKK